MIEIVESREQLERCLAIRLEVFVEEQAVPPEEEIDALDTAPDTIHLLAVHEGRDVGTARVLSEGPGHCHIGRVAVRAQARGTGVGRELMDAAAAVALERCSGPDGKVEILLSSQEQAMGFYRSCGYEVVNGERYLDAGIWHQDMVLRRP
ncbi:GNAT family N-acetyltransferase [Actinomycetaceae bacterium L2_0104]